jgi:phosphoglycolate phosphatase
VRTEPPPALLVFDLDGTLIDSRRDIAESANQVLVDCGCEPHSEAAIGQMVGDGAAVLMARAFEAAGCPPPPDALERFLHIYNARLVRHTRPYAGVVELLDALASRATLALLTNKPLDATRTVLGELELARFFGDRVLGGDGPLPRKPDPAGLLRLTDAAAATPAETMMVGDSEVDVRTARAAGTRLCVARYGFGFQRIAPGELNADDLVLEQPGDLLRFL